MNLWDVIIQGKWLEPIIESMGASFFIITMLILIGLILWYIYSMGDD